MLKERQNILTEPVTGERFKRTNSALKTEVIEIFEIEDDEKTESLLKIPDNASLIANTEDSSEIDNIINDNQIISKENDNSAAEQFEQECEQIFSRNTDEVNENVSI